MNTTTRSGPKHHRRHVCENPHCRADFKPGSGNALGLCCACYQHYRRHGVHRTRKYKLRTQVERPPEDELEYLRQKHEAGATLKSLADLYDFAPATVRRWLSVRRIVPAVQTQYPCRRCEILVDAEGALCQWCIGEGWG